MSSLLRCLSALFAFVLTALCLFSPIAMAGDSPFQFNGRIRQMYVANTFVLLYLDPDSVDSKCPADSIYNLSLDLKKEGADFIFKLLEDAFFNEKNISGILDGCGEFDTDKILSVNVNLYE